MTGLKFKRVADFGEYSCTGFFADYIHQLNESSKKIKEIKEYGIFENDLFDELLSGINERSQIFVKEFKKRQDNKEMYGGGCGMRIIELMGIIDLLEVKIKEKSNSENFKKQELVKLGVSEKEASKIAPDYNSGEDLAKLAALKKEYDGWILFLKSGLMEDAPMTVHELTKYVPKSQISYFRNQKNND
jgi:hypothetical protein